MGKFKSNTKRDVREISEEEYVLYEYSFKAIPKMTLESFLEKKGHFKKEDLVSVTKRPIR